MLYKTSKPEFISKSTNDKIIVSPRQALFYPASEALENELDRKSVIVEHSTVNRKKQIDYSAYRMIDANQEAKCVEFNFAHIEDIDSGISDTIRHTASYLEGQKFNVEYTNLNVS